MWYSLLANFATVGLFLSLWLHLKSVLAKHRRVTRMLAVAALLAAGTIASMTMAKEIDRGVFIDFRSVFLCAAPLLEGPTVGIIVALTAATYRTLLGGAGMFAGLLGIVLSALLGIAGFYFVERKGWSWTKTLLLSFVSATVPLTGAFVLPAALRDEFFNQAFIPGASINVLAFTLTVYLIKSCSRRVRERQLLDMAIEQAPDYFYVKARDSTFVAVNSAVAKISGVQNAAQLIGKSDYDVASPDRAPTLYAAEQDMMRTGRPLRDLVEGIPDKRGVMRFFETTKLPVKDGDGRVIGLVGITRDTTDQRALHQELEDSWGMLKAVLSEMADGVAVFDEEDRLVFCNEQYHSMFPRTRDVRRPGTPLPEILRAALERGEQPEIPRENLDGWIATVVAGIRQGGEEEIRLFDGRWLLARNRCVAGFGSISVVSDVTEIRNAEQRSAALAAEMKVLATMDALTSVLNRRALDEELEREVARSRRSGTALSLIMIDVDRFKALNDAYGHPAGDECLRRVADVLRRHARRASDLVARYGGEEFCVVLPETDEEGARLFAETLRAAVRDMRIENEASECGFVTISAGVAAAGRQPLARSASELMNAADQALYAAKLAGRDRVCCHSDCDAGVAQPTPAIAAA